MKGGKTIRKCTAQTDTGEKTGAAAVKFLRGMLSALYRLVRNGVYVFSILSTCSIMFSAAGILSFLPKYLENQFSLPTFKANFSMAAVLLTSATLGTFLGGYLTKRFQMGGLASLKFVCCAHAMTVVFAGLGLVIKCEQPHIYNSPGPRAVTEVAMSGCYDNCTCDDNAFFPLCDADGRTFFSPCHAGCAVNVGNDYANCTCIPGHVATAGMCDYSCNMYAPFLATMWFSAFFETVSLIPRVLVLIRSVGERDKPLALGLSAFMTSIPGWLLGPIIFGKIVDGICIQWEKDPCTGTGACSLYDNDNFRLKLIGYQTAFRGLGFMLACVALGVAIVSKRFDKMLQEASSKYVAIEAKE